MHTLTLSLITFFSTTRESLLRWCFLVMGIDDARARCRDGIKLELLYTRPNDQRLFWGTELQIRIDCIKLFGNPVSSPEQIADLRELLEKVLAPMVLKVPDMKVKSIDFCKNFYVDDPSSRELLLELWNKTHKRFKRAIRIPPEMCATKNKLYWDCKDSYNVQLYDKEAERDDKGKEIASYENGLMRLEYQIREEHIKYWAANGRRDDFDTWADWCLRARYMTDTEILFFNGDFYNLPRAKTKLNKAVRTGAVASQAIADRIYQFMVDTSRCGIDYAFAKVSRTTAKKYIDVLSKLEINPIPIPKNRGTSFLENPLRDFYEGGCMA